MKTIQKYDILYFLILYFFYDVTPCKFEGCYYLLVFSFIDIFKYE